MRFLLVGTRYINFLGDGGGVPEIWVGSDMLGWKIDDEKNR